MTLKMHTFAFVLFLMLTGFSSAFADQPTFGFELNFDNETLHNAWLKQPDLMDTNNPVNEKVRDKFSRMVKKSCKNCVVTPYQDRYDVGGFKVRYPDGWGFDITLDPGVIEIILKPVIQKEYKERDALLSRDVYAHAQALDLKLNLASHLNIGTLSAFNNDVRAVRNFTVDYFNHPELALGGFNKDLGNAPPLASLLAENQMAFEKLIRDVDEGRVKDLLTFAKRMNSEVYSKTTVAGWTPPEKYQSLNFTSIADNPLNPEVWRVEMRSMRALTRSEMGKMLDVMHSKIELVNEFKGFVPYLRKGNYERLTWAGPQQIADSLYHYLAGTKLKYSYYSDLLPVDVRHLEPYFGNCVKKSEIQFAHLP